MAIRRICGRQPISALVALSALVFAFAWATDRRLPPDELVNRPDGSILCGHRSAACEHRM